MDEPEEFVPTDVFKHRYRNPQVLIDYVKTLPDNFTDNDIKVKILDRSRLGLKLPRELKQEEINGAIQAFITAAEARQNGA
ncbi:hypothetical protein FJTKL_10126 [Diaporthe vaccinii]|uniref:Uncharacterized protein n=1 Tax=Diaporthe vaccinii TaxID=105482 RepID=A0ABR4ELC5_9PEZI